MQLQHFFLATLLCTFHAIRFICTIQCIVTLELVDSIACYIEGEQLEVFIKKYLNPLEYCTTNLYMFSTCCTMYSVH